MLFDQSYSNRMGRRDSTMPRRDQRCPSGVPLPLGVLPKEKRITPGTDLLEFYTSAHHPEAPAMTDDSGDDVRMRHGELGGNLPAFALSEHVHGAD